MNKAAREQFWKYSLITLILFMGVVIFRELAPYLSGILGASTIYIIVRNQMKRLTQKRKLKRSLAAAIILTEAILCFLIPLSLAVWLLINEINGMNLNTAKYISQVQNIVNLVREKTGYNVLSTDNIMSVVSFVPKIGQILVDSVASFSINSMVLLFFLYFMLLGGEKMERYIYALLPFREQNKKDVMSSINMMVKSNAVGIPILAIAQGSIATIGYIIFDTPSPILFGFLTCFASIIPIVGTMFIWFPLVVFMALTGDWINAIGLALYALLIISNIDNLLRFMLQQKIADTHPLITIVGAFIGLSMFGFWGVIFGPLLISIFLLCVDIFKREYLEKDT